MDLDVNFDALMAALEPPPGHQRVEDPDAVPAGGFAFEMGLKVVHPIGGAQIDLLEAATVETTGTSPISGRFDALMAQRLVSAEESLGDAITEAVAELDVHPISAVGRVTAMFAGRLRYCTGTVIAERLVLTAAHCAYAKTNTLTGDGEFADWMVFQPQYLAGAAAGRWAGEAAYVPQGWANPRAGTTAGLYDFALIRLDAPIAYRTGTAGILSNYDPEGPFTSLGYPRKATTSFEFDGRFLFATTGARLADPTHGVIKAQNGLTEGSSGGPWFTRETGEMRLVGLNSTKPVNSDDLTWSPVLGEAFQRLLARALADMTGV